MTGLQTVRSGPLSSAGWHPYPALELEIGWYAAGCVSKGGLASCLVGGCVSEARMQVGSL